MNFALFGRFFLEFAMMYPAEYLCLASLQEHLRAPRKTYAIGASAITLMGLAGAAVCCMLDMETNFLLIPLLIICFWLLRWRTDREVSISQTMFLFSVSAVMMSVCTLLAVVLNAEAELDNAQPVFLPSTSVICLTLSVILSAIFRFTAVRWSRWLLPCSSPRTRYSITERHDKIPCFLRNGEKQGIFLVILALPLAAKSC